MDSRKIVNFFIKTLIYGGIVGLITSFIVKADEYIGFLTPFDAFELLGIFLFSLGLGLVFTVIAQTGFFAYLFVHRYGESIFRSFWSTVQILLILFALFDLVYFSAKAGEGKTPFIFYIIMTAVILIVSLFTARLKVKQTNRTAFIPTMFFMIVVTGLELSLVLRAGDMDYIILMLVPVLFANSFQILKLHEATQVDEEHLKRIEQRRKERAKKLAEQNKLKGKKGNNNQEENVKEDTQKSKGKKGKKKQNQGRGKKKSNATSGKQAK